MYKIMITLKSDLCASSGDGFAAAIDTDICTDRCGLPVIPARRIKGCLRDAADLIGTQRDVIDGIFGVSGSSSACDLRISDARLVNADELSQAAEASDSITPAKVTELFTYTRASTAIDEKTNSAKDQSLRFMRVVKHYSPFDGKELQFAAEADIPDEYAAQLGRICRALRNIGFKRNRGLGAVSCELVRFDEKQRQIPVYSFSSEKEYTIRYTVKLTDDVMISGSASDESLDFIPGTSLLGFFANEYLKTHEADSKFEDIFLKNGVRFSNLCISDRNGTEYFPAPVVTGKIKGEKNAVNVLQHDRLRDDKIVKPLKSGYTNTSLNIIHPLTETVYHINRNSDSGLYTQTAIRKNQYFRGTLSGKGALLEPVYDIMRGGVIRVGRSKTAQYSSCRIIPEAFSVAPAETGRVNIVKDEVFVAAAISDVLLPNGMCGYASDMETFAQSISQAFGFDCGKPDSGMKMKRSALKFRNIHGFNTQWNLSKPHIRAIAAGSAAVFTANKDYELPEELWLGEKNGEGFGCVRIIKASELVYKPAEKTPAAAAGSRFFEKAQALDRMRAKALDHSADHTLNVSSSQIGRAVLMAKQADSMDDFLNRIRNIADDKTKTALESFIKNEEIDIPENEWREYVILLLTLEKYKARTKEEA